MLTSYIVHRKNAVPDTTSQWLLAIDTSADRAGVALYNGEDMRDSTWPAPRSQTTQVLPNIQRALDAIDISTDDLGAISVAVGPGTFTGLRVGTSLAKGLAMAQGIPIIGVPTLAAISLPWVVAGVPVMAVLPAGRGRLVWQRFRPDMLERDEAAAPINGTPDELLALVAEEGAQAIVGELPPALTGALEASPVPLVTDPGLSSRIGAIAQLGMARHVTGDHDDLATLEPVYVHGTSRVARPVRDAQP